MTKNEVVEHLTNSTVKIDNASRVGTGFFIAEKLIATCYHNIKGHAKEELSVYWQGEAYGVRSIEINQDDDLALLEIKIDKKHPILQIDETVEVGDDCQSFGYSRKNGDVITFEYEGKDGDGRLKFKEGLFQSGLSGGAILNFRTHKICGIVKSKRDNTESVALGGRGISISKLFGFERLDIDNNGSIFSKEMFKNWVWTSSVESADRLQFSVLALVETLVAVGLSFFVWIYYGFYWHIVIGLLVAPLFLLKTRKSEDDGLKLFHKLTNSIENKIYLIRYLLLFLLIVLLTISLIPHESTIATLFLIIISIFLFSLPVWFAAFPSIILITVLISKIISTIMNLLTIRTSTISTNWFELILSTDSLHPIEIMPNMESTNSKYKIKTLDKTLYCKINLLNLDNKIDVKDYTAMAIFYFLLVPVFLFRYSLKSTAWIYLPLIWLIQPQDKKNLNTRLKVESKNFIAYLMFLYSLIVVFVFTLLPLIFPHTQLGVYLQTLSIPPTLKTIFFAYEFNLWHLTRLVSALITIMFMFSFTKILIRRESEPSYGDFWGTKLLSLRIVRSFLTLVTLGFTAYHILGLLPSDFFSDLWLNMKFS